MRTTLYLIMVSAMFLVGPTILADTKKLESPLDLYPNTGSAQPARITPDVLPDRLMAYYISETRNLKNTPHFTDWAVPKLTVLILPGWYAIGICILIALLPLSWMYFLWHRSRRWSQKDPKSPNSKPAKAKSPEKTEEAVAVDPQADQHAVNALQRREPALLQNVLQIIESNLDNEHLDTHFLCRVIGMSRAQLYRKLKTLSGYSTARFIRKVRLSKAKQLLEDTELAIGEIAVHVGYKDFSHFSRSYAREFGRKPSETRSWSGDREGR